MNAAVATSLARTHGQAPCCQLCRIAFLTDALGDGSIFGTDADRDEDISSNGSSVLGGNMPARRGLLADAGEWRACVCGPPPLPYAQAIFFRRRHQPRRPPLAKIRPGTPAPAMGAGTVANVSVSVCVVLVPGWKPK